MDRGGTIYGLITVPVTKLTNYIYKNNRSYFYKHRKRMGNGSAGFSNGAVYADLIMTATWTLL